MRDGGIAAVVADVRHRKRPGLSACYGVFDGREDRYYCRGDCVDRQVLCVEDRLGCKRVFWAQLAGRPSYICCGSRSRLVADQEADGAQIGRDDCAIYQAGRAVFEQCRGASDVVRQNNGARLFWPSTDLPAFGMVMRPHVELKAALAGGIAFHGDDRGSNHVGTPSTVVARIDARSLALIGEKQSLMSGQ